LRFPFGAYFTAEDAETRRENYSTLDTTLNRPIQDVRKRVYRGEHE
jgi:hypothetical protein